MRPNPGTILQVLEMGYAVKRIAGLKIALWKAQAKLRVRHVGNAAVLGIVAVVFAMSSILLGLGAGVVALVEAGLSPAAALGSVAGGALFLALAIGAIARGSLNKALNS